MKQKDLTFKFTLMFAAFIILSLSITAVFSMINQTKIYKEQREESALFVASYLEELLVADDIYFTWYQNYYLEKCDEFRIPFEFDTESVQDARHDYEASISQEYPGLVLGEDIDFKDLSPRTKMYYEIYSHEYYQSAFEKAREMFDLKNIYYMVPKSKGSDDVTIIIDSVRKNKTIFRKKFLNLGKTKNYPKAKFKNLWKTWETGKITSGYDSFNQKCLYYKPLYINGEKIGVIAVEVELSKIMRDIYMSTIQNMAIVGGVLIVFSLLLLLLIRAKYIKKLIKLRNAIEEYSQTKDTKIANQLKPEITNEDEISAIILQFTEMIYEVENYIENLTKAKNDLRNSQKHAIELNELATKDSLTGIRNKTAYDREVKKIEIDMNNKGMKFGIAMIDLNFLKKINDNYGHDKGNISIITLCQIVCRIFKHSPVFRIGGDEFVVILKGHDLEQIDNLIVEFNGELKARQEDEKLEYWEKTSAAIGYAVFDPKVDASYENIFKRADDEMYRAKKEMKASRE
ncbi:MAG: GGDEF domain-containing protein [Treponema sp.]|nr:GGDEF domain-containing protein [Treponema sp.]